MKKRNNILIVPYLETLFRDNRKKTIILDADDTLWYDACFYRKLKRKLITITDKYGIPYSRINQEIAELQLKSGSGEENYSQNITKVLHRINISASDWKKMKKAINTFRQHPLKFLEDMKQTLQLLKKYTFYLLSKGSQIEQMEKLKKSGLESLIKETLILRQKNKKTIQEVFYKWQLNPESVITIGNNIKEDIIPALHMGSSVIWINHKKNLKHNWEEYQNYQKYEVHAWKQIKKTLEYITERT